LDLFEHEQRRVTGNQSSITTAFCVARELFSDALCSGLVEVALEGELGRNATLVLSTSSNVGFATIGPQAAEVNCFVRVSPKVGTNQMLRLAKLAGMLPHWTGGRSLIGTSVEAGILEWTLGALEEEVARLVSRGGIRPTHERVRQELESRVRGRLLTSKWLSNVAKGQPQVLPCEFPSLEVDNTVNRLLLWALHVAAVVARDVVGSQQLYDNLRRLSDSFRGVALIRPSTRQIRNPIISPNLRHYTKALQLARLVIESVSLGATPGHIDSISLSLDMNVVYERAFFNAVKLLRPSATRHKEWPVAFSAAPAGSGASSRTRTTKMVPDVWIPARGAMAPLILDTKWKSVMAGPRAQVDIRRAPALNSADIYQATAYALEALTRGECLPHQCVAALIYPTLADDTDYHRKLTLGAATIHVALCGWNVAQDPIEAADKIIADLERLATLSNLDPRPQGR
jgi:5-methylcytosine-specific restriction endonuclease McrBC regulatory subunit McrC